MPDVKGTDPFTLVYDQLWELVNSHPTDIFRVGNKISFGDDNREPFKRTVSAADVPELVLVQDGGAVGLHTSTSSTSVTKIYSWLISTGDFRLNHFLNPVEWHLLTCHVGWCSIMTALRYNDNPFVKKVDILDVRSGVADAARNRGLQGWSSVWRVQVDMYFKTQDLKDERTP